MCKCDDNLTVTTKPVDDGRQPPPISCNDLHDIRLLVHKTDTNRVQVSARPTTTIDWLELRVNNLVKITPSKRTTAVVHHCSSALPIAHQPTSTLCNGNTVAPAALPPSVQPPHKPSIKVTKCKATAHKSTASQLSAAVSDSEIIIVSDEFRRNATDHQEVVIDHKRKWMKLMKLQQQQLRLERMMAAAASTSSSLLEVNGNHHGELDNRNGDDTNHSAAANNKLSRRAGPAASTTGHQHRHGRKQLVIVSDAFRRDACRQTDGGVVIVDDSTVSRRRQRQMRKDATQETSIDDVGNKLKSHAFHSYDEDDETLERKQLDDGLAGGVLEVVGN